MAKNNDAKVNPKRTGVFGSEMKGILAKLESNKDLQKMYDGDVLDNITIVSDNNTLRIEDAGKKALDKEDEKKFLKILKSITG